MTGKYKTLWRGLPLIKTPFEIVTFQQMLWNIKPRTILEFGSNCGGSAIWMADTLQMYGCNCHIYSIDIDLGLLDPLAKEKRDDVTFIEGDSYKVEKAFPPDLLKVS
jgi:cephalosporin hydroxylase